MSGRAEESSPRWVTIFSSEFAEKGKVAIGCPPQDEFKKKRQAMKAIAVGMLVL